MEVDFARSAISAFQDPVKQEMAENNEETTIAQGVKIFAQSAF